MTCQPGLQAIAVHILPNIYQSEGKQTIKFGRLIEYNKGNIFFKNYALDFGCILVATSDNVVTMLSQHFVSDVITTTKN